MDLALFDFDGTITTGDSFTPFIAWSLPWSRLANGAIRLSPRIVSYWCGRTPATLMRSSIVRAGFHGRSAAAIFAAGERYAKLRIPRLVRPYALERIEWHKARGDRVVVVSASLDAYLRPWCGALGLDLICSELEVRGERLTGEYVDGDCMGEEKARRVRARYELSEYESIYAYGDTEEDRQLLELAHHRYLGWEKLEA